MGLGVGVVQLGRILRQMQSRHPVVELVKLRLEMAAPASYIPASFQRRASIVYRPACFQISQSSQR